MLKVQEATLELNAKGYNQIQEETAWKWASRAAASFGFVIDSELPNETKHVYYSMANSYYSEALEHAAEVSSALVQQVMDAVIPYQNAADNFMTDLLREKE
jgi:Ni,Fe-hydrogenase I small subunit